jgi:hypothetical protein
MRTILAMSAAAILAMLSLMGVWAAINHDASVRTLRFSDADMWVICVEESDPTDANMRACDDAYGEHEMRVLRP